MKRADQSSSQWHFEQENEKDLQAANRRPCPGMNHGPDEALSAVEKETSL